ncbi:16S rRNA (uracil(1498)-N(3))-methyltransferase [Thiovibrio frasassiensis]|uniref:Ribosomal RNA small subunit methyltransferase E n=1 Tax=Thiovibrio frasassiensis TaxID=2984131 RepID=A0A9X4RM79_9BACT|nr:16S rRNA (uracil(1498)-N(3))-methyltransferase [Thiovibrio frasassiensis]MDG4476499.1 16S rRNA (uracil(1498)-N(3))-methyltransferase [Thiovibrio frasassiensis]
MNLILLDPKELTDHHVTLSDRRAEHIRKILRASVGDTLRVGVLGGLLGTGCIREMTGKNVVLAVHLTSEPPPCPPTDLILAVPRPIMLKRVLAQAVSMGVTRIFLINANRVEKSFFSSTLIQNNDFREPLCLGLEQAMDTRMPEISVHPRFRPFVEDFLPEQLSDCLTRLLAHPDGDRTLAQAAGGLREQRALLAIGPEGGWVDFEVEHLKKQGFIPFSLGARILRVDTAVPALLGQLSLLRQLP